MPLTEEEKADIVEKLLNTPRGDAPGNFNSVMNWMIWDIADRIAKLERERDTYKTGVDFAAVQLGDTASAFYMYLDLDKRAKTMEAALRACAAHAESETESPGHAIGAIIKITGAALKGKEGESDG